MASSRGIGGSRNLFTSGSGSTNVIPNPPVFSTASQLEQQIEQQAVAIGRFAASSSAAAVAQQTTGGVTVTNVEDGPTDASNSNQMEALVTRYYWELDKAHEQMKREEHEKRLKSLRKELDWIASTQWMYPQIDKLIGQ